MSTKGEEYESEDEEDKSETAGLLSPPLKQGKSKLQDNLRRLQMKSRLRPLEIIKFAARHKRLRLIDGGALMSNIGAFLFVLSIVCGIWWWSGKEKDAELSVARWHKLKVDDIRHWCLDSTQTSCKCPNPLEAQHRKSYKTWSLAHAANKQEALDTDFVDVVFLGDSITEGWRGTSLGKSVEYKEPNVKVFNSLFHVDQGADFQGLPLGIAGDKTFHLLWRIQNGELPDKLRPSVWWITIGTNDFLKESHCSPEVVLMGIKRVVEQVRISRPGSIIVVNSLLPRSTEELNGKLVDSVHPEKKTVWEGIMEVNRGLRRYCEKYFNVVYFDATDIFLAESDSHAGVEGMYIPRSLMEDYLHPTAEGYRRWGESMVEAIHEITDASKSKMGRKPLPHWQGNKQGK